MLKILLLLIIRFLGFSRPTPIIIAKNGSKDDKVYILSFRSALIELYHLKFWLNVAFTWG